MVNGITFSEQLTTSADFAHFQNTFLNSSDGVTKGCDISQADGNIYIQKGYFVICGRFVRVVGLETIATPDVLSGQIYCKLVFEVDLTKTNTADDFNQGYFKILTSVDDYPGVTQDDLDADGTLYQMPWCQFIKAIDGISEWRDLRPIMSIESIWAAVAAQNTEYKGEFDTYFTAQQAVIEQMITELEGQGYVLLSEARRVIPATLTVAGWTGTAAPYTQTVAAEGITAADNPMLVSLLADDATADVQKAYNKAFGIVASGTAVTGDGTVTFKVYKLPAVDIVVGLKGV